MPSHGGVVQSSPGPGPGQIHQEWLAELYDHFELLADPDGRAEVLLEMAAAAHRRQEVGDGDFGEMLEMIESARLWGLSEGEV